MRLYWFALIPILFLSACLPVLAFPPLPTVAVLPSPIPQPPAREIPIATPTFTITPTETLLPSQTPFPSATLPPSPTLLPIGLGLDPADWKNWPVNPIVPRRAREIYQIGQVQGNDPHAFSVFGDCQAEPGVFMSVFETEPTVFASLPSNLQETVSWFRGSFNRESPTVKGGTTTGALMYPPWHQNMYTCSPYETPLQCELRIHKPAFVIIQVGTHYESHNDTYMRKVLDQVIAAGVVPILATKADDSELDEHVNAEYAQLAVEYAIPFWNFWAAVKDLPNHGLHTRPGLEKQGPIYLIGEAVILHRTTALQALDTVWRAVAK